VCGVATLDDRVPDPVTLEGTEFKLGFIKKFHYQKVAHHWKERERLFNTFLEYQRIVPLLTDAKESGLSFKVIISSLPAFGFSEGT